MAGWLQLSQLKLNPVKIEIQYLSCGGLISGIQLSALNEIPLVLALRVKSLVVILDVSFCGGPSFCNCHVNLLPTLVDQAAGFLSH